MKIPFTTPSQNPDPLNRHIPYSEKNFEIGFLSSILHTFILIFFAELGDKTFIMLFILQLRTNKVTIFYSALFAEILMNITASVIGFLFEYLLYKNLIEYLGILFFAIYGVFLILSGFKTSEDTFEEEFEMIEDMHKQRINRTPSMILGIDEDEEDKKEKGEKDKYNLDTVNKYNEKTYVPLIKKELTIIPESDISREDSVFTEDNLLSANKKDNKDAKEDDDGFILKNNSSGFQLNLKKRRKGSTSSKDNNNNNNNTNKNKRQSLENSENILEGNLIVLEEDNENNNQSNNESGEDEEEGRQRLRGKPPGMYKSRSRYALDYLDKDVNVNQPNIDNSIFGTIFFSICLSEFGDRTQLISLTASSMFHFWGSILGSCLALFCSCLIGVYFSRKVMKYFRQKVIDFILGAIFLTNAIQIFISKRQSQMAV